MSLNGEDKKKKRSLLRSLYLYTFGEFALFNYLSITSNELTLILPLSRTARSVLVRVVTPAADSWLSYKLGHCATCFLRAARRLESSI